MTKRLTNKRKIVATTAALKQLWLHQERRNRMSALALSEKGV